MIGPRPSSAVGRNDHMRAIEIRVRSRQLARLLDISADSLAGREETACVLMAAATLMPILRDKSKRRAYCIETLEHADRMLPNATDPSNADFTNQLRPVVIQMQEFPWWFSIFTQSAEELIRSYWWLNLEVNIVEAAGFGGALMTGKVLTDALSGAQQAKGVGGRAVMSSGVRSVAKGSVSALTGGLAGRLGGVWVIGTYLCSQGSACRDLLRRELQRRYQEGRLTPDQYVKAMGIDDPLPAAYLYRLPQ